jgi:hypothetical protein
VSGHPVQTRASRLQPPVCSRSLRFVEDFSQNRKPITGDDETWLPDRCRRCGKIKLASGLHIVDWRPAERYRTCVRFVPLKAVAGVLANLRRVETDSVEGSRRSLQLAAQPVWNRM